VFERLLIANRGEIAVRIARTCREMGIRTVAVYSDADEGALHAVIAGEAHRIGPALAADSYLSIGALMQAARESGADAVHPGYGFLAENREFASAVVAAGLTWIGPPAAVIERMGDKVAAKELARSAGVPIVPGYDGSDQTPDRIAAEAQRIGFPIMLKAAAGGGGRGMRAVSSVGELPEAIEGARREALAAFGEDRIFVEKLLDRPRHVEVQILFDGHGNGIHLGERDCSIQRRHQKVVEESPSPILTDDLRLAMGGAALRLARAAAYVNAGTVEFLFSDDQYFFLEMNTRVQVEHPVTELVTGLDIIRLQIEIAAGGRLPLSQLDVRPRGHAIEVRLYAEDPANRFLPVTGTVAMLDPPDGPGVRNDVGVSAGSEITTHYDSMLAKLIVHADTRAAAVARLQRALREYTVLGLTTNVELLSWIAAHPDFERRRADVSWLETAWSERVSPVTDRVQIEILIGAALHDTLNASVSTRGDTDRFDPWRQPSSWREFGLTSERSYGLGGEELGVTLVRTGASEWLARAVGEEVLVRVVKATSNDLTLRIGERIVRLRVAEVAERIWIGYEGCAFALARFDTSRSTKGDTRAAPGQAATREGLTAPMPGTVVKVAVSEGQLVDAHEPLVVLEAMKMEHVVEAPHAGVVRAILFAQGDLVPAGAPVVEFEQT
jgi:3-methylcrotonyl-CoA carboxylase alpha subunit